MNRTLVSIVTLCFATFLLTFPGQFMEPVVITCGDSLNGWFPMLNLNHNAYLMWRLDHLSQVVVSLLAPNYTVAAPLFQLIILLLGSWLITRCLVSPDERGNPLLWLRALMPVLLLLAVVGINPFVIGTLAWVPLVAVVSAILLLKSSPRWWWCIGALVVIESCRSSNEAAIIASTLALLITFLLLAQDGESPVSDRRKIAVCALVLLPALYTIVTIPLPPIPDYPKTGHVVPDEGPEGVLLPLIGQTLGFESLHRADVRELYDTVAIYLTLLALTSCVFMRRGTSKTVRSIVTIATIISIATVLDTSIPESFASIAPLASLSRLLPWGTQYCLTAICLGSAAWLIGIAWISQPRKVLAVVVAAISLVSISRASPTIYRPFLEQYLKTSDRSLQRLVCSPSAAVIRHFAREHPHLMQDLHDMKELSSRSWTEIGNLGGSVVMHPAPSPEIVAQLPGAETYARWSPRRGKQLGDELLLVRFAEPVTIRGIELDPGNYFTDFPRGLRITGGECDESRTRLLTDTPSWQGSLAFTPKGYPYLSARNQVRVFLNHNETVSCLYVYQTSQATFDWSVSRVRVLEAE